MNDCEDILIQKWALTDGEKADLPAAEINAHLAACESCRLEIEQTQNAVFLLERHERLAPDADLWSAIEKQTSAKSEAAFRVLWQPFVLTGVLLIVYKLLEMLPARDLGWTLKLVPFVLMIALFGLLKENPFKINTEMVLEK